MSKNSILRRNSRYVQGGTTQRFANRLGYWQRRVFPRHDTDEVFTLDVKYDRKPWLLAYDKYRNVELMWLVLQYNTILDVETEFVAGKEIRLPTATRVFMDLLSNNPTSLS